MFTKRKTQITPATEPANVNEVGRRGRPRRRSVDERTFGMTLRIPASLRKGMRRLAEHETEQRGQIVSIHELMLEIIAAELRARGYTEV